MTAESAASRGKSLCLWMVDDIDDHLTALQASFLEIQKTGVFGAITVSPPELFNDACHVVAALRDDAVPDIIVADLLMPGPYDGAKLIFDELVKPVWEGRRPLLIAISSDSYQSDDLRTAISIAGASKWARFMPKPKNMPVKEGVQRAPLQNELRWRIAVAGAIRFWHQRRGAAERIELRFSDIPGLASPEWTDKLVADLAQVDQSASGFFIVRADTTDERLWLAEELQARFDCAPGGLLDATYLGGHDPLVRRSFVADIFGAADKAGVDKTDGSQGVGGMINRAGNGTLLLDGFDRAYPVLDELVPWLSALSRSRRYTALGDTKPQAFAGRVILALAPDIPTPVLLQNWIELRLPRPSELSVPGDVGIVASVFLAAAERARTPGVVPVRRLSEALRARLFAEREAWTWAALYFRAQIWAQLPALEIPASEGEQPFETRHDAPASASPLAAQKSEPHPPTPEPASSVAAPGLPNLFDIEIDLIKWEARIRDLDQPGTKFPPLTFTSRNDRSRGTSRKRQLAYFWAMLEFAPAAHEALTLQATVAMAMNAKLALIGAEPLFTGPTAAAMATNFWKRLEKEPEPWSRWHKLVSGKGVRPWRPLHRDIRVVENSTIPRA